MKSKTITILIFLLIITISLSVQVEPSVAEDLTVRLSQLDDSINQAFVNASFIEESGSDITIILLQLNNAAGLLAEAQNAYASGDFSTAASSIENSEGILYKVNIDLDSLIEESAVISMNRIITSIAFSIFCSVIFIVALLLTWKKFKRSYFKRFLKSKPQLPV